MSILLTAGLAALMAAGSGPKHGYGMAVTPAEVTGPSNSHATFRITDTGHIPLNVTISPVELRPIVGHPKNWAPAGAFRQARISPRTFHLTAGQSRSVSVTIRGVDSYRHDIAIYADAQIGHTRAGASVSSAVAARYVVNPHAPVAPSQTPIVASAPTHHQWPLWAWIALGSFLAALLAAIGFVGREVVRRSSKRRHASETAFTETKVWPYRNIDGRSLGDGTSDPYGRR